MRRALVVAVAGFLCCGAVPNYVSHAGVEYYSDVDAGWTPEQIETQEANFIAGTASLGPSKVAVAMRHALVEITPDKFWCGASSPTGYCNGLEEGVSLTVRNMGCPYNSALAHELLHWTLQSASGDPDWNHTGPLWATVDVPAGVCP